MSDKFTVEIISPDQTISKQEIIDMGFTYNEEVSSIGDLYQFNQWVQRYYEGQYDKVLFSHDDNYMLNDELFLDILENRKNLLYKKRNEIQDSLMFYRNNGIISIIPQVERLTEQYAIALSENNISGAKRIKSELNNFAKFAGPHDMLLRKSYVVEEELALIESESERLSIDATYSLDNKFTINKAFPADKKTSPVRWLIVFCSVVSVSIFYIFLTSFLYLIDEFKHEFEQE